MTSEIFIQNLKCAGCAGTIVRSLSAIDGISQVEVDQERESVKFEASGEESVHQAEETLSKLGYPPTDENNTLLQKAKSFVSCAIGRVENLMEEEKPAK